MTFDLTDVGILILDAVAVLHRRGHERLRVLPGMSGSGMHWRTSVSTAESFSEAGGYLHIENYQDAFGYTTGAEFEVAGTVVTRDTSVDDLADRMLALMPSDGLGADAAYARWYTELMDLIHCHRALPIAYADYFEPERGWEIGWGSGIRFPAPPTVSPVRGIIGGQNKPPADAAESVVAGVQPPDGPAAISNTANSAAFELMLENLFLSELLQEMWFGRGQVVDVLHSPDDAYGYDLVLQCGSVTRHVQLKTKRLTGKTASYKLSTLLYNQPAACVVILEWDLAPGASRLDLTYRWFGGAPTEPIPDLGDKLAKHTKGDSKGVKKEKPLHRVVPLGRFTKVSSMSDISDLLFGPLLAGEEY